MAGPTVEFLGRVPDDDLPDLLARCKAFLFPGLEDFGIAPVEGSASSRAGVEESLVLECAMSIDKLDAAIAVAARPKPLIYEIKRVPAGESKP